MQTKSPDTAILLLSCLDTQGIVSDVSHFIFTYGGNILDSNQHSDVQTHTFFMRVEWELSKFKIPQEKIAQAFEPIALKFGMNFKIQFSNTLTRLAIFVSQYDHCLYDLILRNREGETHAEICLIIGNHPQMKEIADSFGLPFHYTPMTKETKDEVENQQIALLKEHQIDLVVLARYMQILSPRFIEEFPNTIINIHHSFLPAFIGAKPYHQAYARGVKIIGATSHYVTQELDQGPIIEQDVTRISHRDSVRTLVIKGRNLEKIVLSKAVKLHLEHRVLPHGNKTVVFE
ncbi:MAG: formyltetrahydrofolate deformylase [Spirochaetales bacterium]|nr:formyltetrahydrofolate deformylase [Spirochaetales bacterium]